MKVVLRYEQEGNEPMSLKLTLPKGWKEGGTIKLKEMFIQAYNRKYEASELDLKNVCLVNSAGVSLGDEDIVSAVIKHGDHLRIMSGASPRFSSTGTVKASLMPTPGAGDADDTNGNVGNAAAVKAAVSASNALDYSKWDRIDISDDDAEDCHPNIDKESWKRLMGRKREERREQEEKKIEAYKKKIEKYNAKAEFIGQRIKDGDEDAQLLVDLKNAEESAADYQAKLDHFLATRKMTAEDLCHVSEDHTAVAKSADIKPVAFDIANNTHAGKGTSDDQLKPEKPPEEGFEYQSYVEKYMNEINKFASLRNDQASKSFLMDHPVLLHEHHEGYLLLRTLDVCMKHLDAKEAAGDKWSEKLEKKWREDELAVSRQHMLITSILFLSKGKKRDPRDMVNLFFAKTTSATKERVDGFEDDLNSFVDRIRNRAAEKKRLGEPSPLAASTDDGKAEVQYEDPGLGPGGLHPNDVLQTLPNDMQEAFISQDTEKLKEALKKMSAEEADYHFQRCIDSGLWQPGPDETE